MITKDGDSVQSLRFAAALGATWWALGCTAPSSDEPTTSSRQPVTSVMWVNVVSVTPSGNSLTKLGQNAWNGGAASAETLSGDGYVEFTSAENNTSKMAGLSSGDSSQSYADIDFAIQLASTGGVGIYESGTLVGYFGQYAAGDVFRVTNQGGVVSYSRNGAVLYTSLQTAASPLLVDTSLRQPGATITDLVLGDLTFWQNAVNVSVSGNGITKTGPTGWNNAGASSVQTVGDNEYVEFTSAENNTSKMAGLSNGDTDQSYGDIDYAIQLTSTGGYGVFESGTLVRYFGQYSPGDVFRVDVSAGVVHYKKNGSDFYASTVTPTLPLLFDTSLKENGATIQNVSVGQFQPFWLNAVNVTALDNNLVKTGPTSWNNAGAVTSDTLSGDGFVQVTASETTTSRMVGLSNDDTSQSYADIDYAIQLSSTGKVGVYESGTFQGYFGSYVSGDALRVETRNDVVTYQRNGNVLYTSAAAPTFPLLVDTSLKDTGATINDVIVYPTGPAFWQGVANFSTFDNTAIKTDQSQLWNAFGSSVATISGAGYVEVTTSCDSDKKFGLGSAPIVDASSTWVKDVWWDFDHNGYVAATIGNKSTVEKVYCDPGTVFRIEASAGIVTYKINGVTHRTASYPFSYPLHVHLGAQTPGTTFENVQIGELPFWQAAVGVSTAGNGLTKTDASDIWNAGASTVEAVNTSGYLDFGTGEADTAKVVGFSNGDSDQSYTDIDFGIYLAEDGTFRVYENGVPHGSVGTYTASDTFRINVTSAGVVGYRKNGVTFYVSGHAATHPLLVDTALRTPGATIKNVFFRPTCGGGAGSYGWSCTGQ